MPLDVSNLLSYARTLENSQLLTLALKKAFSVKATSEGIEIIPASTRKLRRVKREAIQKTCDEFALSKSMKPVDYRAITFDASYFLAIIDRFLQSQQRDST